MKLATFYDHVRVISQEENLAMGDALREVRALGVELLEISQNNLVGREDEVCRELAWAELGVSSVPAYFDFGRNPDVDRQSEEVLEAARFIGADKLLVIPGFFGEEDPPKERARQIEQMEDCIRRLGEKAAGYGISLIMEDFDNPLSPCATMEGVRQFLDHCPSLSCCFDTGNFRFMAQNELDAYELLKDRIAHVHLKDRAYTPAFGDAPRMAADGKELYPCPVGAGEIEIEELLKRLQRDGRADVLTLEHYGASPMLRTLKQSVEWVRQAVQELRNH